MARDKNIKLTKQEKRKVELNQLLGNQKIEPIPDFYDYIKAAIPLLDKNKEIDRVFSRWLKKKFHQARGLSEDTKAAASVQEYIDWGAERLASEMDQLERWYVDSPWKLNLSKRDYVDFWKRIVALWWEKDSFPELSANKMVVCAARDIVIYVLMVLEFSVDEADQFLDEFCRMKKSKDLRMLYFLDYKEGLFRWIISWNENHPEQKISYGGACLLYEKYGGELLDFVKAELVKLCINIVREDVYWREEIISPEYGSKKNQENAFRVLDELDRLKINCKEIRANLCNSREELYNERHAENLKRAWTICVYGKRLLEKRKEELRRRNFFSAFSLEKQFQEIRKWTDETAANRGTEFAWFQMMKYTLPVCQDFEESFETFKKETIPFLSDAYWGQFSQLMKLYGMSGGFYEEHKQFVHKDSFSTTAKKSRLYKNEVLISQKDRRYLSFALGNQAVAEAIKRGTDNGMYLSELTQPVWRNAEDIFSYTKVDSESKFSMLWAQYENWCRGKSGPYEAYTRNTILELALAANMQSMSEIQNVMLLAGSREWNLLDSREALVYLVVRYRDTLKKSIRDISDLMETVQARGIHSATGMELWRDIQKKVQKLPPAYCENIPELMCDISEIPKDKLPIFAGSKKNQFVQEVMERWQDVIEEEVPVPTVIEYLHMADRMGVLFRASSQNANEIREKMFYEPYTTDFIRQKENSKKGVAEKLAWLEIQRTWGALLNDLLDEQAVRIVFGFWYSNMQTGLRNENFLGISIDNWEEALDLVGKRMKRVENQLEVKLEMEFAKEWKTKIRGKCENINDELEAFHQAIVTAKFMKQDPNAAETKYILEQWITLLAMMELMDVPIKESVDRVEEYVYHWIITGGLNYFDYRIYTKKAGIGSPEYAGEYWEEQKDPRQVRKFWKEIYHDYRILCASVCWYEKKRPDHAVNYRQKLEAMKQLILKEGNQDVLRDSIKKEVSSSQTRFGWMKLNWEEDCDDNEIKNWYQQFYKGLEEKK